MADAIEQFASLPGRLLLDTCTRYESLAKA